MLRLMCEVFKIKCKENKLLMNNILLLGVSCYSSLKFCRRSVEVDVWGFCIWLVIIRGLARLLHRIVHSLNPKETKDLRRLTTYWFITKPFELKECMKYTMTQFLQENGNRRLKGSNGYLIHKPIQLHDLWVELHYSLAPHITWGAGSRG